jgi:hypothetical protein
MTQGRQKMKIPFRQPVEITRAEQTRLASLQREFITKLQGLPEARRNAVIKATAHNVLGDVDPYTRANAQQMLGVIDINDRITASRAELQEIEQTDLSGHRPKDVNFKARILTRKHELEESIKEDMARAIALRENDLQRSREETVMHFRDTEAQQAKTAAILSMRDTIREQAEQREVAARALALVNSERLLAGKPPLPDGDD